MDVGDITVSVAGARVHRGDELSPVVSCFLALRAGEVDIADPTDRAVLAARCAVLANSAVGLLDVFDRY